jgi:hypothetical protein
MAKIFRAGLAVSLVLLVLTVGSLVALPAASAGTAHDEQQFVQLINQARANVGLPALVVDSQLTTGARSWSTTMAQNDQLAHSPNMADGLTASWTVLGENVGVSGSHDIQQLFQAFLDSPSHYQNVVDPRFQYLGVGVVHSANGKLWTTHRFMAASSPPPTAPPTTAAPTTLPPTTVPTTQPPTTQPPTTAAPTTSAETTTQPPTTPPPTTAPPTTAAPTTAPTTAVPTTGPATTSPATALPSTTGWPGTATDQNSTQADMAKLVRPDVATIEEVLLDLLEAGI